MDIKSFRFNNLKCYDYDKLVLVLYKLYLVCKMFFLSEYFVLIFMVIL